MLEQYCDLRRRGFSQTEIQLKQHHPSLLSHANDSRRIVVEFMGHDPDAYYTVGVKHRILKPTL